MKNIYVLPTPNPSKLYVRTDVTPHFYSNFQGKPVNMFITSDEKIKDNDWFVEDFIEGKIFQRFNSHVYSLPKTARKIILTTDEELIKNGIQAIDDEFLEWFVKNPSCEFVEVKGDWEFLGDDYRHGGERTFVYKIIIPKEELKQETLEENAKRYAESNQYDLEYYDEGGCQGVEVESFAEKLVDFTNKWQEENSNKKYSEEEVYHILCEHTAELFKGSKLTLTKWFEQFKKK